MTEERAAQRRILLLAIPAGGIFLGVTLGTLFGPLVKGGGIGSAGFWFLGAFGLAAAGTVLLVKRAPLLLAPARPESAAPEARAAPAAPPAPPAAFPVQVTFPAIAPRHPDVWGLEEPLAVNVRAAKEHAGAPVTLIAWHEGRELFRHEGTLGAEGDITFTLQSAAPVDLHLDARVTTTGGTGRGARTLRFNRYEEEIKHTFSDFRAWALERIGREDRPGLTAREIMNLLEPEPAAQQHLGEVLFVLEVISYGERKVDRGLYLHFLDSLLALDEAGFFANPRSPPSAGPGKRGGV